MVACHRYLRFQAEGLEGFIVLAVIRSVDFNFIGAQNPIVGVDQESDIQSIGSLDFAEVKLKVSIDAVETLPMSICIVVTSEVAIK